MKFRLIIIIHIFLLTCTGCMDGMMYTENPVQVNRIYKVTWELTGKGDAAVTYYLDNIAYVGGHGLRNIMNKLKSLGCKELVIEYPEGILGLDPVLPFPVNSETLSFVRSIIDQLQCKVHHIIIEDKFEGWGDEE